MDPNRTRFGPRITSGSGVRGQYGNVSDLAPADAFHVALDGYLYATEQLNGAVARSPECTAVKFVIGRDPRPTGEAIRAALLTGFSVASRRLNQERASDRPLNVTVIDVEINTTPVVQNAVRLFDTIGGAIITASHNPTDWNGYKFLTANKEPGDPYTQGGALLSFARMAAFKSRRRAVLDALQQREAVVEALLDSIISTGEDFVFTYESGPSREQSLEGYFLYVRRMAGLEDDATFDAFRKQAGDSEVHIIVDHNGGAAKEIMAGLLRKFGLSVEEIGGDLGVTTHEIEPMDAALQQAKDRLTAVGNGFAVVHDWDADRGTLVLLQDGKASDLGPQYTCALNAYAMIDQYIPLARTPAFRDMPISVVVNGNTTGGIRVIADRFSKAEKINVNVVEVETGEVNLVEKLEEIRREKTGIPVIGVEGSCGGVIFGGSSVCATSRDGTMTALMAAKLTISRGEPLGELVKVLPVFHTCFKSIPDIAAESYVIKQALEKAFLERIIKSDNGSFTLSNTTATVYAGYEILHYIGAGSFSTMGETTNGGYKIRLTDTNGNESFVWFRDSKTEPEIYIESDSTNPDESEALFVLLLDVVAETNNAAKAAAG